MITVDTLRTHIHENFSAAVAALTDLVAIPSISSSSYDQAEVARSAQHVAGLFSELGADVEILTAEDPTGQSGRPAVVAQFAGNPDAPTVLLYAHHDVQPVGDYSGWTQADPFQAEERDGRLYGRGTADDGAGVITHVTVMRTLLELCGPTLPCPVTIFIEGEEEVGSPSFANFLQTYRERLAADVIVVADSSNWKADVPSLTTSLRGVVQADVTLRVLDHALHSGMYGGPIMDAPTAMCRLIATCHDDAGDVAVPGLVSRATAEASFPEYPEADFRADAGMLDGVQFAGTGDLTAKLWTKPTITLIGMDVTPLASSSNTLAPACTARLSMRIAPGQDPQAAFDALADHLRANVPFGAHIEVSNGELGPAFDGSSDTPVATDARWALSAAFGTESVDIGQGGSIPFVSDLQQTFPEAEVLVTGIEDPDTRAHSEDESMHLGSFENIVLAESLLLARLGKVLSDSDA